MNSSLTSRALTHSGGQNITEENLVDVSGLNASTLNRFFHYNGAELFCRGIREGTAHLADSRTASAYEYDFFAHVLFLRFFCVCSFNLSGCASTNIPLLG
ncbi:hypothetical protein DSECCO2_612440 [anaerobic digester metagenome]